MNDKIFVDINMTNKILEPFRIAGFVPLSTVDWPDQLAAVIFTQGCPWRCGYCHNAHLIPPRGEVSIAWDIIFEKIKQRKNFLDAVVISGGEPLLQRGLTNILNEIRALGLKTGLHTSGSLPKQLEGVSRLGGARYKSHARTLRNRYTSCQQRACGVGKFRYSYQERCGL
jgi:radical SAM superfamily enzyme YgiQ (UPF0313 family)